MFRLFSIILHIFGLNIHIFRHNLDAKIDMSGYMSGCHHEEKTIRATIVRICGWVGGWSYVYIYIYI